MALNDIIRSGIAIADSVTKGVQGTVSHRAWTGQDGHGTDTFAAPVNRRAVVDVTRKQRPGPDGVLRHIIATVIFLEPVPVNGTATTPPRFEPIDPHDIITLPDGTTGPIIHAPDSVVDPATNRPFFNQVYLGEV